MRDGGWSGDGQLTRTLSLQPISPLRRSWMNVLSGCPAVRAPRLRDRQPSHGPRPRPPPDYLSGRCARPPAWPPPLRLAAPHVGLSGLRPLCSAAPRRCAPPLRPAAPHVRLSGLRPLCSAAPRRCAPPLRPAAPHVRPPGLRPLCSAAPRRSARPRTPPHRPRPGPGPTGPGPTGPTGPPPLRPRPHRPRPWPNPGEPRPRPTPPRLAGGPGDTGRIPEQRPSWRSAPKP